jgi:tRNA 2-thiouridine synthesizing protein A
MQISLKELKYIIAKIIRPIVIPAPAVVLFGTGILTGEPLIPEILCSYRLVYSLQEYSEKIRIRHVFYAVIKRDAAMPDGNPKVDKTLDVRGLVCPRPKVVTERTLEKMESGQSLCVITNDISTKQSIPSLCERLGYEILAISEEVGILYFTIRK